MSSALDYLPSLAMGTKVSQATGVSADGVVASGYAALIYSITGAQPSLVPLGGKKVKILLTPAQNQKMKVWLERQVASGIKIAKAPSNLTIDAGPFVMPVVLKYAIPAATALFVIGWFAHAYFTKR